MPNAPSKVLSRGLAGAGVGCVSMGLGLEGNGTDDERWVVFWTYWEGTGTFSPVDNSACPLSFNTL